MPETRERRRWAPGPKQAGQRHEVQTLGTAPQHARGLMIVRATLQTRAREWGLTEEVVEKDYVLGWLWWASDRTPRCASTGCSRVGPA